MKAVRYAAGALAGLLVAGFPFLALSYSDGAPSGFTGPEQYCTACHFTYPLDSGTGSVVVTAPPTFTAGVAVPITVTVVNTTPPEPVTKTGFQVSVRDAASTGTHAGDFIVDGTTVQLAQGHPDFVTHTTASNAGPSWTFQWVPPAADVPDAVTVYAVGNAANGDLEFTGDYIYSTTVTLTRSGVAVEEGPVAGDVRLGRVAPNPVRAAAEVTLTLARPAHVVARLLDAQGREVRRVADGARTAGPALLRVETLGLAAGPYLLEVVADGARATRALTVAR